MSNKFNFRLTPLSEQDIASALDYIANKLFNEKASADLFFKIEHAIEQAREFPYSAKNCAHYLISDENIRHIPIDNYILIYEIADNEIRILRFLYSKMDLNDKCLKH